MAMNPRTHPRGAAPDFTLPTPNPNPTRIPDALWWLVCMRLALEPTSRNGGVFANKAGYHNAGKNLPDHGQGSLQTDHSIRWSWDRTGPWWREFAAAHDWTFENAHHGDYTEISLYTGRLIRAMRDPSDLRPDDVYAYTIGQADNDLVVEGWNERTDGDESGDQSHLWHRHDSFRRNIVGDFWVMWKALTIDMGWTYAEWKQSLEDPLATLTDAEKTRLLTQTRRTLEMIRNVESLMYALVRGQDVRAHWKDTETGLNYPSTPMAPVVLLRQIAAEQGLTPAQLAEALDVLPTAGENAQAVLDALDDADRTDEEVAAALKAALGDRAGEVGRLLADG